MSVETVKLLHMGNMWRDGRVVGGGLAVVALGALGFGGVALANAANTPAAPTPTAVVETIDFAGLPYTNGLAGEQESESAAVVAEQARVAAEQAAAAEAARVAAEQAAAVEAERVAAEQVAADEPEDPGTEEPSGGIPAVWVDLGNGTGMWDFSHCPTGSGTTGADGNVYCS